MRKIYFDTTKNAKDIHGFVRSEVAQNRNTPTEILKNFVEDEDEAEEIRDFAKENLNSRN